MTEPRHCQGCGRVPITSHEFSNSISPGSSISAKGPVALTCPNCLSSTPRFDSYREALICWNLKQISAEELYELKQIHRAELREEIREELKQEILEELDRIMKLRLPDISSIINMVSNI